MSGDKMSTPLGDMTTIPVTTSPIQAVPALGDDSSVVIYNQDLTNVIYASYSRWFQPGAANSIPIQPLTFATLSAKRAIYLGATTAVQPAAIVPEGTQLQPSPAQIAAQISALGLATFAEQVNQNSAIPTNISTTGVPLLNNPQVLASAANIGISASSSNTVGPFNTNQPSFELGIASSFAVANGATPYTFVVLYWIDPTSNLTVAKDTFVIWTASHAALNSLPFIIRGPSKAGSLKLVVFNLDTVDSVQVTYTLLADSRVIPSESIALGLDWKEDSANIQLFTNAATRVLPDSNVVATFVNGTLAASSTDTWITPPATGLATLNFQESGVAAANIAITVQPVPATIYGGIFLVNDVMVTGNPNKLFYSDLVLPNGPLQVQIKNNGTVAANYNGMLTAQGH
jgi:hypothetical protein